MLVEDRGDDIDKGDETVDDGLWGPTVSSAASKSTGGMRAPARGECFRLLRTSFL